VRQTKPDADPYRDIVEYYDLEHDLFRDDIELIERLVETVGDPVLELACGTGRVLEPLARPGRRLTGIDTSPAMLAAARRRLENAVGEITLREAAMTDLPLESGKFGMVIVALNGLLHATTSAEQRLVLREGFRSLDPRGMLYLDLANPAQAWPHSGPQPVLSAGTWVSAVGERVQKFQAVTVDSSSQVVSTENWYDVVDQTDGLRRLHSKFNLRYIHAAELELMLELAGFVEWQIYGSYELDPITTESPRIIALAEKTPSG
jgi:ubiquinone/menaquinone biosynthesis C-methylase UbiE